MCQVFSISRIVWEDSECLPSETGQLLVARADDSADVYSVPCPGAHLFLGTLRKGSVAPKSKKAQRVGEKQMQAKAFRLHCPKQGEVPRDCTQQEWSAEEGRK